MFRKELLITLTLALGIFIIVALLASMAVRNVQRVGESLARDTLPGLVYAGSALNRMNENWMLAYRLLEPELEQRREELIQQIDANSTGAMWQSYKEAIFDRRDAELFAEMESNRRTFLAQRALYFELIRSRGTETARSFFDSQLETSFRNYRSAAVALFKLNVEEGQQRADRLIRLSRGTPLAVGGLCVLILLSGVLLGFKASLGAFLKPWAPPERTETAAHLEQK